MRADALRTLRRAVWAAGWPARTVVIGLVRLYQATLAGVLGGQCRFHPTCSAYALEAIRNRGALVGATLTTWRILRCNPQGRGGLDPAPGPRGAATGALQSAAAYDNVIQAGVRPC